MNGLRRDRHETRVKFRLLAWRKYANDPWRTILVLVGSIIVSNSVIIFSNQDSRDFFTNWSINTKPLHIVDVYPNGNHSLQTQNRQIFCLYTHHFYCGIGLVVSCRTHLDLLSTCIGNWYPFPSSADAFWLSGYGFFTYFMFRIYNLLSKGNEKFLVILVSLAAPIILGYILNLTFGIADLLSAQQGSLAWLISIAYPILDGILLVPAVLILWSLRGKNVASANWSLLALSIVLVTVGDIGFGYSAVIDKAGKEEWVWDLFYNSSYLVMAAAFFLQSRVFAKGQTKIIVQK